MSMNWSCRKMYIWLIPCLYCFHDDYFLPSVRIFIPKIMQYLRERNTKLTNSIDPTRRKHSPEILQPTETERQNRAASVCADGSSSKTHPLVNNSSSVQSTDTEAASSVSLFGNTILPFILFINGGFGRWYGWFLRMIFLFVSNHLCSVFAHKVTSETKRPRPEDIKSQTREIIVHIIRHLKYLCSQNFDENGLTRMLELDQDLSRWIAEAVTQRFRRMIFSRFRKTAFNYVGPSVRNPSNNNLDAMTTANIFSPEFVSFFFRQLQLQLGELLIQYKGSRWVCCDGRRESGSIVGWSALGNALDRFIGHIVSWTVWKVLSYYNFDEWLLEQ